MAIKDILVHASDDERGAVRTDLACAIARANDGHVVGVGINSLAIYPSFIDAQLPPQALEVQAARIREKAEAAERSFNEHTDRAGVSAEWRLIDRTVGDVERAMARQARYVDLTIIGQPDPDEPERLVPPGFEEQLVLDAGGPVILVPFVGTFARVGQRVLVAWNGTREAKRAVADALPFMLGAEKVTVLEVNPGGDTHAERDVEAVDLAAHLARHGVRAEAAHIVADDIKVGDMILSRATDLSADLIVMGAYGRSRLRELVLGGATRYLFRHMTIPVLMSH